MKKITIFFTVLLYSLTGALYAQNDAVLKSLYQKMSASAVSMDYSYVLKSSGFKTVGNGTVTVQDSAYVMNGSGLQICCDGKTVWTVDQDGKEVLIESPAEGAQSYMDNPALLFVNLSDTFTVDGVKADGSINTYVLSPKVSCGIKTATLSINASGEPVITSAVFALADGSGLDIKIKSMTFSDKKPLTSFCFDVSVLDSSWLITDIR